MASAMAGQKGWLVVDRASNEVEQLVGDGLLAALVVLQVKYAQQFVGIVCGGLHRHHTCGVLGGDAVKQGGVEHKVCHLWHEGLENGIHVWLHDVVIVEWFHVDILLMGCCTLHLQVLLRFLCHYRCFEVTLVVSLQLGGKVYRY